MRSWYVNTFYITGPLWGESIGHLTKGWWCVALMLFLCSLYKLLYKLQVAGDLRKHDIPVVSLELTVKRVYNNKPVHIPVLKIRGICHAWDPWKLALSYKQFCLLCPIAPQNLPGTALLSGFQSSRELWNPLSKTVLRKCSFIWNKGPKQ